MAPGKEMIGDIQRGQERCAGHLFQSKRRPDSTTMCLSPGPKTVKNTFESEGNPENPPGTRHLALREKYKLTSLSQRCDGATLNTDAQTNVFAKGGNCFQQFTLQKYSASKEARITRRKKKLYQNNQIVNSLNQEGQMISDRRGPM